MNLKVYSKGWTENDGLTAVFPNIFLNIYTQKTRKTDTSGDTKSP